MDISTISKLLLPGTALTVLLTTAPSSLPKPSAHLAKSAAHKSGKIKDGYVPIVNVNPPPDTLAANASGSSKSLMGHGPMKTKDGLTFTIQYSGSTLEGAAVNTQLVAYAVYDADLETNASPGLEQATGEIVEDPNYAGASEYDVTFNAGNRGMPRQVIFTMKQLAGDYNPDVDTYVWNRPY